MSRTSRSMLANVLGYQLVWFACVSGASAGRIWQGPLAAILFTALTLRFGGRWREDLRSLAIVLPLGLGMDSMFVAAGSISYSPAGPWPMAAPIWIAAIWLGFGMTLNHSLDFLRRHLLLASVMGMIAAPLAYWGAARGFDVIAFSAAPTGVLLALALCWSLLLPLVFSLDGKLRSLRVPA